MGAAATGSSPRPPYRELPPGGRSLVPYNNRSSAPGPIRRKFMHPLLRWPAALFCAALLYFVPVQAGAAPAQNKTDADTAALPAGVERVHSLAGINEYRLANGLRVLPMPDPTPPQITLDITHLLGSRHEGYAERRMPHLVAPRRRE